MNTPRKVKSSDLGANKRPYCPHTVTELLDKKGSQQATEFVAISSKHKCRKNKLHLSYSSDSSMSSQLRLSISSQKKPSNIGNVMVILSTLPDVVAGDDFWMDTATYLVKSKAAREFVACEAISPELKLKWLHCEVQTLKK